MGFTFYLTSILLGLGLSMDACAVSMTNGLNDNKMNIKKALLIAFSFGLFQGLMPLIGYFTGQAFIRYIEKFIPYIALVLLLFLGGKMIFDGIKEIREDKKEKPLNETEKKETDRQTVTLRLILAQAFATSIDALSVGLTFADYSAFKAVLTAVIIAGVTFLASLFSVFLGKKFGSLLGSKAIIFGGIILIAIGLEIFLTGIF